MTCRRQKACVLKYVQVYICNFTYSTVQCVHKCTYVRNIHIQHGAVRPQVYVCNFTYSTVQCVTSVCM